MQKILYFDFDGVIVESFELSYRTKCLVDGDEVGIETYRDFFNGNIFDNMAPGQDEDKPGLGADHPFFIAYEPELLKESPVPGVVAAMEALKESSHIVIVSSTADVIIERYLKHVGIDHLVDRVMGCTTHKSKVRKIEMAKEIYGIASEDGLFITDTLGDMREAAKAGVRSVGVTWGAHDAERFALADPVAVCDNPSELVEILEQNL